MTTEAAPPPITPLSPQTIAEMSSADAATHIEQRMADKDFSSRYLSGSGPHVSEMRALMERKLSAGDRLDQIIAGTAEVPLFETVTGGQLSTRDQLHAASMLKELGISDAAIREAFEGKPVATRAEYDKVMNYQADLLSNPEWVAKYKKGDREAQRQMMLCHIVKVNGYQQSA